MNEQQAILSDGETTERGSALVPVGIASDDLIAAAASAEKRIEAVKKIIQVCLKVTNENDWTDIGGNPYMEASGAQKIAPLFGISWTFEEPVRESQDDGHFMYTYSAVFSLGSRTTEAIGTRSSKDKFFSEAQGAAIPVSEIDPGDVKKAAFTNCLNNGIKNLLGLRNLTWEQLEHAGLDRRKMGAYQFKSGGTLPNYGDYAKQPIPAAPTDALKKYLAGLEKSLADHKNEKYRASNLKCVEGIKAELAKREADKETSGGSTDETSPASAVSEATPPGDRGLDLGIVYQDHRTMVEKSTTISAVSAAVNTALDDDRLTREQKDGIRILRDKRMAELQPKRK